ncbi:hypothetical protein HDU90_001333 [Geranomyces variabilis]|nr:hypothetical protein HDU90_001333 [Geranomyces variabilis]
MGDYDDDERLAFEDQLYQDDGSGSASDASGDDEHELAQINYNHSFTLDAAVKSEEEEEEEEEEEQGEPGNLLTDDVTAFSLKRGEDEERSSEDMEISENDMPVVISSSDDDSEESEPSVEETLKSPDTLRVVQMRTAAPTEPGIELKELFKDSPDTRRKPEVRYFGATEWCRGCRQMGHHISSCPEKETLCYLCKADHNPAWCPLNSLCFNCMHRGHLSNLCPNRKNIAPCLHCANIPGAQPHHSMATWDESNAGTFGGSTNSAAGRFRANHIFIVTCAEKRVIMETTVAIGRGTLVRPAHRLLMQARFTSQHLTRLPQNRRTVPPIQHLPQTRLGRNRLTAGSPRLHHRPVVTGRGLDLVIAAAGSALPTGGDLTDGAQNARRRPIDIRERARCPGLMAAAIQTRTYRSALDTQTGGDPAATGRISRTDGRMIVTSEFHEGMTVRGPQTSLATGSHLQTRQVEALVVLSHRIRDLMGEDLRGVNNGHG